MNYGVQRSENGGTAVRAIAMLPALTGAWKHRGGGGQLSTSGAFKWDKQAVERPDLALASPLGRLARWSTCRRWARRWRSRDQGSGIRDKPDDDGPTFMRCLFITRIPGAVAPNQNAVRRGLMRADLFTVVHELFFTDTTDYADYILPATTFLEHTDIQGAYGHYFVQLSNQAIDPPGEARSNVWLFSQLAQRMGFTEECFRDTPEEMIRQALAIGPDGHSTNPGMEHMTFEELKQQGHIPLELSSRPGRAAIPALYVGAACHAFRQDRVLFRDAGRARPRRRFRALFLLPNRDGARTPSAIRSNSSAARPTTT